MSDHFSGNSIPSHLKLARKKGAEVQEEIHGRELSGFLIAFADSAKDTIIILALLLQFLFFSFKIPLSYFFLFFPSWILWKGARSTLIGWSRLKKLHSLIEQEKWEITNHPQDEKKELTEMYRAKGFDSPLLEQVVDVLVSDNNRLLKVMLEEEFGLTLEIYEHPLKQGLGALLGALLPCLILLPFSYFFSKNIVLALGFVLFCFFTIVSLKKEKVKFTSIFMWNLVVYVFIFLFSYFLLKFF